MPCSTQRQTIGGLLSGLLLSHLSESKTQTHANLTYGVLGNTTFTNISIYNSTSAKDDIIHTTCGLNGCPWNDIRDNSQTSHPSEFALYIVFGVFLAFSIMSSLCTFLLPQLYSGERERDAIKRNYLQPSVE